MINKEVKESLLKRIEEYADAKSDMDWKLDQGYGAAVAESEARCANAFASLMTYIDGLVDNV